MKRKFWKEADATADAVNYQKTEKSDFIYIPVGETKGQSIFSENRTFSTVCRCLLCL
jgi:hypothetical protein